MWTRSYMKSIKAFQEKEVLRFCVPELALLNHPSPLTHEYVLTYGTYAYTLFYVYGKLKLDELGYRV